VAGKSPLKNTSAILDAWRQGLPWPLTVVCQRDKPQRIRNVEWHSRLNRRELITLMNAHMFHVCPSQYEGWGHYIHEALSCKAIVITTAAPPMDEFGTPGELHVQASGWQRRHLARCALVSPNAITRAVETCSSLDDDAIADLGTKARRRFQCVQEAFEKRARELVGSGGECV
jgi:hypothetical protein